LSAEITPAASLPETMLLGLIDEPSDVEELDGVAEESDEAQVSPTTAVRSCDSKTGQISNDATKRGLR